MKKGLLPDFKCLFGKISSTAGPLPLKCAVVSQIISGKIRK